MLGLHLLDEELTVQALPHQAPLHVGEGDDDGVDLAGGDQRFQLVEGQHGADPIHLSVRQTEDTRIIDDMP